MSNNITIELCSEDRARIDQLTLAIVSLGGLIEKHIPAPPSITSALSPDEEEIIKKALAHSAREPAQRTKPERATTTPPTAEAPTAPDSAPVAEEKTTEPAYTMQDLRGKVITLTGAREGEAAKTAEARKEKVKAIIRKYGANVPDIPVEKYPAVMQELNALEGDKK